MYEQVNFSTVFTTRYRSIVLILCLLFLVHLPGLKQVFIASPLRDDSDTAAMLDAIQQHGGLSGALRWFQGDWLLENGFYRPISSVSLTLDYALYGEQAWGFRLTNWLMALLTAWGVFFLARWGLRWASLEDRLLDGFAAAMALAFSLQQVGIMKNLGGVSAWWVVLLTLVLVVWKEKIKPASLSIDAKWLMALILPIGAMLWGWERLTGTDYQRMITWVPSRTALTMSFFAMWGLLFALKGCDQRSVSFLLLGVLMIALALGAYEQTITLIPLMALLAFERRKQWGRWAAALVLSLIIVGAGYALLRVNLVTTQVTAYQQQQLRSSRTIWAFAYSREMLPIVGDYTYWKNAGWDIELWMFKERWDYAVMAIAYAGVFWVAWRYPRWMTACWFWHALTFAPMSALHEFEHYYYLPQMGKNGFDIMLLWAGGIALSGRILQRARSSRAEQAAHNRLVGGSNPSGPTSFDS